MTPVPRAISSAIFSGCMWYPSSSDRGTGTAANYVQVRSRRIALPLPSVREPTFLKSESISLYATMEVSVSVSYKYRRSGCLPV